MRTNKSLLRQAVAAAIATSTLLGSNAFADEYHYKDILIGDRAAGLGGLILPSRMMLLASTTILPESFTQPHPKFPVP